MSESQDTSPRKRRWLMPLLFTSLAVNLLILGIFLGAMLSPDGPRQRGEERAVRGVVGEPFFRALPKEERRALIGDVLRNRQQIRENRESLRQRFEAFLVALRADPFQPEEISRLMAEQRDTAVKRQEFGETLLLNRLQSMTPQQRADYADALEEALRGLRRR